MQFWAWEYFYWSVRVTHWTALPNTHCLLLSPRYDVEEQYYSVYFNPSIPSMAYIAAVFDVLSSFIISLSNTYPYMYSSAFVYKLFWMTIKTWQRTLNCHVWQQVNDLACQQYSHFKWCNPRTRTWESQNQNIQNLEPERAKTSAWQPTNVWIETRMSRHGSPKAGFNF